MAKFEIKDFNEPDETRPFQGKGKADLVMLGGRPVARSVFEPGWRWSNNVKPIVGTDSCQIAHLGYCLKGRMRIYMTDGAQVDIEPGQVAAIPPGHDAEVLGDSECVFVDFGELAGYAKPH